MKEGAVAQQKLPVSVREMREADLEGVLAIDRKITGQNRALTYANVPSSFLGGQLAMSVVAEAPDGIVGFLLGQMVASPYEALDIALVQVIGVDPAYRRQHIGEALMKGFMDCCRGQGIDSVHVMVSVYDWWMLSFLKTLDFKHGEMVEFVKSLD